MYRNVLHHVTQSIVKTLRLKNTIFKRFHVPKRDYGKCELNLPFNVSVYIKTH